MRTATKYPHLFSPLTVRGFTLRNRIISSPHSDPSHFTDIDGKSFYADTAVRYYSRIARGGAALVTTGHLGVDPRYTLGSNKEYFYFGTEEDVHKSVLPALHRISDGIHAYGALAGFELNHGGRYSFPVDDTPLIGPCDMLIQNKDFAAFDGKQVVGMDEEEMERVADYFAYAASVGKRGGFDAIVVHAGHNWLLGQFLSPIDNHRDDAYGGSVENRARFPLMVFRKIRETIGNAMLLSIRISASELVKGGITPEEVAETIRLFEPYVDIVQCSVGRIKEFPTTSYTMPTQYAAPACNAYLAEAIKPHVHVIIETVGAINDPEQAEKLVAEGKTDLVAMARSFCADPDWARKAKAGTPEDIRPCIRCMRCLAYGVQHSGVSPCTVNPQRMLPYLDQADLLPGVCKKHVAVIGGGPAGMAAAIRLADKGHSVVLFEKSSALGGRLYFADHMSFKYGIRRYRDYLITQVQKRSGAIEVRLSTPATPEKVRTEGFDAVVLAVGAADFVPPIPGKDRSLVRSLKEVLGREDTLGENITVIGGGAVGCEAAIHLKELGKRVTVVEMAPELIAEGKGIPAERNLTLYYLTHAYDPNPRHIAETAQTAPVRTVLSARCVSIEEDGIIVEYPDKTREKIPADTVITATGFRKDSGIYEAYADTADQVLLIGDCNKVSNIAGAAFGGLSAALQI